jgi:Leucyl-tRNA synthetase
LHTKEKKTSKKSIQQNRQEMERYNAKLTEKKWREKWEKEGIYLTSDDRKKRNIMC